MTAGARYLYRWNLLEARRLSAIIREGMPISQELEYRRRIHDHRVEAARLRRAS